MQKSDPLLNQEFKIRLQAEFARRMRANEQYSLRSFALNLGINSSTLSKIFAGNRQLSKVKIEELCNKIGIDVVSTSNQTKDFQQPSLDQFSVIADWYHFAILDLTSLQSFQSDPQWIADKLSIKPYQALAALERLLRLGLLIKEKSRIKKSKSFLTNYNEGTTSAALKEYQRQVIQKALHAVDHCHQEDKDITSITIAADSRRLNSAKAMIKKFRRDLCQYLEGGEADSVFHLAVQLYPVTALKKREIKK